VEIKIHECGIMKVLPETTEMLKGWVEVLKHIRLSIVSLLLCDYRLINKTTI
jgi:hypothetical protein